MPKWRKCKRCSMRKSRNLKGSPRRIQNPQSRVMAETRTYFAVSILSSRTFWVNLGTFVFAVLSAEDIVTVLPRAALPYVPALLALINIWLRYVTVRPVAFIAPGNTLPILVPKLDVPVTATLTD